VIRIPMTISGNTAPIKVSVNSGARSISMGVTSETNVTIIGEFPDYDGPTTVTPSAEQQVLSTNEHLMRDDIIIGPIPENYGLITWNGSVLTVS